jgi:SAM-dependent methyltransferase
MSVLDVGCGPGTITADLAALVAPGRVTAADAAADVLVEVMRLARERELDNVDVAAVDVHDLPYPDGSFDVVHAHQVLQHVADPVVALREMRRVCRPGGLVAARDGDYATMAWYPQLPGVDEWLALYRRVARAAGGEPDAGRRLLSWARRAGFDDVTCTASAWCYASPDERAWWGGVWGERILSSAVADLAISGGHATPDDLRRMSDAWYAWAASEDGWFSVLHGEILCRA